jgi:hypothetical protein
MRRRNLRPRRHLVAVGASVAAAVFVATVASQVTASEVQFGNASLCHGPDGSGFGGKARQMSGGYIISGSLTSAMALVCPFVGINPTLWHGNATSLVVFGRDDVTTAQAGAQACVTLETSNGGACGAQWTSGGSFHGEFEGWPSLSAWQAHAHDGYPYIYVVLPQSGTTGSSFRGYKVIKNP